MEAEGVTRPNPKSSQRWEQKHILLAVLSTLGTGLIFASIPLFAKQLPPGSPTMHLALSVFWGGVFVLIVLVHLSYPIPPSKRWFLIPLLIILAVATIFFVPRLYAQKAIQEQIPPTVEVSSRIEDKIFLYERYGNEWHTSMREPILFTNDKAFLKNRFEKDRAYRFTPTIYNGNKRVALADPVQLYIELPEEIEVEQTSLWVHTDSDGVINAYFANIRSEIPPGGGTTINESLFLKFLEPGRYKARYYIKGRTTTGEGFEPIVRTVEFVLE